ncbi:aldehyde dehydrogenase family protein [Hymenobacter weizhouensis]|uniref:aldehyde dehydrogenase family protein n=1 Tax=Hymenobacter sp. YIM 151500-1 TaxID=2987689 RepID=UPI002227291B|nr:aldehyde dehydrogenase family protein [Hymenobacter sp. YIM 151500-1]UYZ62639.1 aldehyde dehydrogenase family protein [Hymenobacter sp. YIM 151500-1]
MSTATTLPTQVEAAAPIQAPSVRALFARQQARAAELRRQPPDLDARAEQLRRLSRWIADNRTAIQEALYADFRKPAPETDVTEIWSTQTEIRHTLRHLKRWARPRRVGTPLPLVGTRSWVQPEAKGVCLIISPWNYPFYLALDPLVSALAAGNCCIIKPSEMTPSVAALISRLVREVFSPEEVAVVEGDKDVATELLQLPFDHIFFTGSPQVGKVVMRAAAEHLTSVTLELGGKSPAVVDSTADLRDAAEKIVWGKSINAGQTCVAPDYVLVHETVRDELVEEIGAVVRRFYNASGQGVAASDSLARIVNDHHFRRVLGLLDDARQRGATVALGGTAEASQRFVEPTVLLDVPAGSRVLEEEIFGPLLPVLTFRNLPEAAAEVNTRPHPLALYIFSQNADNQQFLLRNIPAGGACLNETILHLGHPDLPFGGFGHSGIGRAHGHAGFLAFSNEKAVLQQRVGFTGLKPIYPPYTDKVKQVVGWLLRWL